MKENVYILMKMDMQLFNQGNVINNLLLNNYVYATIHKKLRRIYIY